MAKRPGPATSAGVTADRTAVGFGDFLGHGFMFLMILFFPAREQST